MLAIPIFRNRVAPVLNWCSRILIFCEDTTGSTHGREIQLLNPIPFDLLRILHDMGVCTLICGALTPELLSFGKHLGMEIIHGVAGDIDDVLRAYREQRLDQPSFRLPGCRGRMRYREGKLKPG